MEAVIGGTLDSAGLTETRLERIVANQTPEGPQIEFKGHAYAKHPGAKGKTLTPEQEFAKDVAALANHQGGVLFIGVDEESGAAAKILPMTDTTVEQEEQRLRLALANFMAPLGVVDFVPVPIEAGGFALAVVVPPSPRSPHAVLKKTTEDGTKPLRYPVRHGRDTRWLEESEVAERYVRRLRAGELEAERLDTIVKAGGDALQLADGLWVYVAIVPEVPAVERLDRSAVTAAKLWLDAQSVWSPLGYHLFGNLRVLAAPGRTIAGRQYSGQDPLMAPTEVHVELHADGSAFVATAIETLTVESLPQNIRPLDLLALTCDPIPLVDLAGRWVTHQAAVPGTARVAAGIYEARRQNGQLGRPVELFTRGSFGRPEKVSDTRRLTEVEPTVDTVYDLTSPVTTRGAVAVASVIVDGLLQWFGQGSTPFINPDGSIRIGPWQPDAGQHVVEWATRFDVPTQ